MTVLLLPLTRTRTWDEARSGGNRTIIILWYILKKLDEKSFTVLSTRMAIAVARDADNRNAANAFGQTTIIY